MPGRREPMPRDERAGSTQRGEVIERLARALDDGVLTLGEHDRRVIAVGTATYAAELQVQVHDLPPGYDWRPHPVAVPPSAPPAAAGRPAGRAALILGVASVPLSFCFLGAPAGVVAVVLSLRGGPVTPGLSAALLGRIFGIIGVVLSVGALIAFLVIARRA